MNIKKIKEMINGRSYRVIQRGKRDVVVLGKTIRLPRAHEIEVLDNNDWVFLIGCHPEDLKNLVL